MILLWGVPGDGPFDAVGAELERRGAAARLLDQRQAAETQAWLSVEPGGDPSGCITDPQGTLDLAEVRAAYIRPYETSKACGVASDQPDSPVFLRALAADTAIITWADLARAGIVNRPAAMAANNSKPYQLALIARCGFAVPDTLVTTEPAAVRRFQQQHGRLIYKSVSGVRSIVTQLDEASERGLADVANCPTQFQAYIPGRDVRVHVAGESVIATEIASSAADYRYALRSGADLSMRPMDLPPSVAEKCRAMARAMGLHLAGIDLRQTPEGTWYCFEVNPSPAFTFFEAGAGQPIAAAVAELLLSLDRPAA